MPDETPAPTDWIHRFAKWLDHYRFSWLLPVAGLLLFAGCAFAMQSTAVVNGERMTRAQFQDYMRAKSASLNERVIDYNAEGEKLKAEIAATNALRDEKTAEYDLKDQQWAEIASGVLGLVQGIGTGTVNPATLWTSVPTLALGILGLFGIGRGLDSRRKDGEIDNRDEQIATLKAKVAELQGPVATTGGTGA